MPSPVNPRQHVPRVRNKVLPKFLEPGRIRITPWEFFDDVDEDAHRGLEGLHFAWEESQKETSMTFNRSSAATGKGTLEKVFKANQRGATGKEKRERSRKLKNRLKTRGGKMGPPFKVKKDDP